MISPDTPPGTEVVCIDACPFEKYLTLGACYTVEKIEANEDPPYDLLACLSEVGRAENWGFELRRFRYKDLPDAITRILETRAPNEFEPA